MKSIEIKSRLPITPLYILPFGSQIYKPNPKDRDNIYIISEDTGQFLFQYKDQELLEDVVYIGINQFIVGLKNCSNVEFFEALHTSQGNQFLVDQDLVLEDYYTPRMIKAYLGYAKRDLDFFDERRYYITKSILIAQMIQAKNTLDPEHLDQTVLYYLYDNGNNFKDKNNIKETINELRKSIIY